MVYIEKVNGLFQNVNLMLTSTLLSCHVLNIADSCKAIQKSSNSLILCTEIDTWIYRLKSFSEKSISKENKWLFEMRVRNGMRI